MKNPPDINKRTGTSNLRRAMIDVEYFPHKRYTTGRGKTKHKN